MRRIYKGAFVLLLCVFWVGSALADRAANVRRIDGLEIPSHSDSQRQCLVGNLNEPVYTVEGWFTAQEEYSYAFTAQDCCDIGFTIQAVHIVMNFEEDALYPFEEFDIYAYLEKAVWDEGTQCWVPGDEECSSDVAFFNVDSPGILDLAVPIDDCDCAGVHDPAGAPLVYMATLYFPLPFDADIVTDDAPVGCTSWGDWGYGWVDLTTVPNISGEIIMYAEVECCDTPVSTVDLPWGGLKKFYR